MTRKSGTRFTPSAGVAALVPYAVPRLNTPIDLYLDGNEGQAPAPLMFGDANLDGNLLRRYPSTTALERKLAERLQVAPEQVIVTAGADDAIYRACTVALAPGRTLLLPSPTFPMLSHYAALIGATVDRIEWMTPQYPTEDVLSRISDSVTAICIVSPNNPTGGIATAGDVRRIAEAAPYAMILLDCAYEEFADDPLTEIGLEYDNVVVFRTLSKAWGLAGLRVGYAIGTPPMIRLLRTAGNPYPVSSLSLAVAARLIEEQPGGAAAYLNRIRVERSDLTDLLRSLGGDTLPSQANFVLARFKNAEWVWQGLLGMGISVRRFPGHSLLEEYLRITLPGDRSEYERLARALQAVLSPEAVLFDMDGVIADVSRSYRTAIIETARQFAADLTPDQIDAAKRAGDANNDWELTWRLITKVGREAGYDDVKETFESIYQGAETRPGLWQTESLLIDRSLLKSLQSRCKLGVVTGRPRRDAERFLATHNLEKFFDTLVCMEDGPVKPDPAPIQRALDSLDAKAAWMIGDTPDDIRSARRAGVVPVGIAPPDSDMERALISAGCGRTLASVNQLPELLP